MTRLTLNDRLEAVAYHREILGKCDQLLQELVNDGDGASHAAHELRDAIATLARESALWTADIERILDRRARIAVEIAKPLTEPSCRTCGAPATPRAVGNLEDLFALMPDSEVEGGLEEIVHEYRPFCGPCFAVKLRGLQKLAEMLAEADE